MRLSDMPANARATCKKCPARIVFAYTKNGHLQPVDPVAEPGGNLELTIGEDGKLHAAVIPYSERGGRTDLHNPHHVTCPNAAEFRKSRPAKSAARSRTNDLGGTAA